MKNKVLNYIRENKMLVAGESVVIGVSGGADSMCLLHIMESIGRELKLKLMVVHIHHGIREKTADRDAAFVKEYCENKGIVCYVKRADVPALSKEWGMSEEEAGRKVRYDAFNEALNTLGGGKIAVAHNADDSAETVLLNLFRGSGIKGMAGILPVRGAVIRPVLCLTRKEIEEYNDLNNVKYVHDETNFVAEYTRNKLRLNIMPAIKESINKRASEHINMTGQNLAQIDDYMESQCDRAFGDIVTEYKEENRLYIDGRGFMELHAAMQTQLAKRCLYIVAGRAKDITYKHISKVRELFELEVGRSINLPYGMVAVKEYEGVTICMKADSKGQKAPEDKAVAEEYAVASDNAGVYYVDIAEKKAVLKVESSQFDERIFMENQYTKWINCDTIDGNLLLRTRRDGDYIVVDHKGSRKKLKDFFIDRKIPREERNQIWLLAKGSEIIWIVGYRLSAAYKVSNDTKKIVRFEWLEDN